MNPPAPPPGRPGKPTPVRSLRKGPHDTEETDIDPERTSIVLEGVSWEVVVDGASYGGSAPNPVRMLVLRFTRQDDQESRPREAWVVGDRLEDLSEDRLLAALRDAEPRAERREATGFFEDLGGRRRR